MKLQNGSFRSNKNLCAKHMKLLIFNMTLYFYRKVEQLINLKRHAGLKCWVLEKIKYYQLTYVTSSLDNFDVSKSVGTFPER